MYNEQHPRYSSLAVYEPNAVNLQANHNINQQAQSMYVVAFEQLEIEQKQPDIKVSGNLSLSK